MKQSVVLLVLVIVCISNMVWAANSENGEQVSVGIDSNIIYANPVTPNVSKEAKALLNYLYAIYGHKMLSGQMESTWIDGPDYELNYIKKYTGKLPAIRGLDFVYSADNNNVVQRAIDWWRRGGIPTIMWHWGAPTVGEGHEASQATIDIQAALTPGTTEHAALMSDLNRIANHLEKLRDANVPVLWRPFHELNGHWFWWSKEGPESFKKLWKLMFNYFTEERKLNNLIWVLCYSSRGDKDWYPGEKYVDIAAVDIYDVGPEPQLRMFNSVRKVVGLKRPVAYHECGVMPDPTLSEEKNVHWSWFMNWHSHWLTEYNSLDHIKNVYNDDFVLTLDELPNIMDYVDQGEDDKIVKLYTMIDGKGKISKEVTTELVPKGKTITLNAVPETGYKFEAWEGTIDSKTNPLQLNVNDSMGIIAKFVPLAGTNLIKNGDFTQDLSYWNNYNFEDQGAIAQVEVVNGQCFIKIINGGQERHHVQLIQGGLIIREGEEYKLSFTAYAESPRKMFVKVGQQGGEYLQYYGDTFELNTSKKHFSKTFIMTKKTDECARIEFNLGLESSNVYLDNISLSIVK